MLHFVVTKDTCSHGFARRLGVSIKESSEAQNVEPVNFVLICISGFLTDTVWEGSCGYVIR